MCKQVACDDICQDEQATLVHIKWAKNLQKSDQFHVVRMSEDLLRINQYHKYAPLIAVRGLPLTERKVHGRLQVILKKMGLDNFDMACVPAHRCNVGICTRSPFGGHKSSWSLGFRYHLAIHQAH